MFEKNGFVHMHSLSHTVHLHIVIEFQENKRERMFIVTFSRMTRCKKTTGRQDSRDNTKMAGGHVMVICGNILSLFTESTHCLGVLSRFVPLLLMMAERSL